MLASVVAFALTAQAFRTSVTKKHRNPLLRLSGVDDPMSGNFSSAAEYCINVQIADQPFCLDLDTGSSDVGVVAKGCKGCPKKYHSPYDPTASNGAMATNCTFCKSHMTKDTEISCGTNMLTGGNDRICNMILEYEDGSGFSAALYEDDFAFMDKDGKATEAFTTVVGAMYKAKGMDDPKDIDGIVGFAGQGASSANTPTAFDNMVKALGIEDVFSLCLRDTGDSAAYLGAEPGITDNSNIMWTPRLSNSPFYAVALDDVMIGGKSLGVDPSVYQDGDCIVDSGTSDTGFPKTAFKAVKTVFGDMCKKGMCLKGVCDCKKKEALKQGIFENKCIKMSDSDRAAYPNITLSFGTPASTGGHSGGGGGGGNDDDTTTTSPYSSTTSSYWRLEDYPKMTLEWTPENYLRNDEWLCDKGEYTISISSTGPDGSGTILGDTFMSEWIVVFDRMNEQIGFLPGYETCP